MSWRRRLTRILWGLILALALLIQTWEWLSVTPASPQHRSTPSSQPLQQLDSPRLITTYPSNDGDSFRITHSGGEHTFRLYFIDCPEKRDYSIVADRLKDQASYFGGLSIAQTLRLGREARDFTAHWLSRGPFQVHTRWEQVFDSDRYYAHLICSDGQPLIEKLILAGLARIHGKSTLLLDGRPPTDYESHLKKLESQARSAQRGAWAASPKASSEKTPKKP